jgi:hypothetical protein
MAPLILERNVMMVEPKKRPPACIFIENKNEESPDSAKPKHMKLKLTTSNIVP